MDKKIIFLLGSFSGGGAVRVMVTLANKFYFLGALKNLAKIYLDYKQLDEMDGEEYYKKGIMIDRGEVWVT